MLCINEVIQITDVRNGCNYNVLYRLDCNLIFPHFNFSIQRTQHTHVAHTHTHMHSTHMHAA